ncbi:MAG: DUF1634 domain-containing protein [Acidobacteriota bacterium]|jgi:uncharacterized membrane protein
MTSDQDCIPEAGDEKNTGQDFDPAENASAAGSHAEEPATPAAPSSHIVMPVTEEQAGKPLFPLEGRSSAPASPARSRVYVPPNLHDLIAAIPITPEEADVFRHRRQLNDIIHTLLTVGLVASTAIMLFGLALDLIQNRALSTAVPRFDEVVTHVMAFRPSGFLALGLLILIATPILRVLGSFAAFVHERDWRFAGITFLVLSVLFASLLFGRG